MRVFAQQRNQTQKTVFSSPSPFTLRPHVHAKDPDLGLTTTAPGFGHDFSRIPIHPPASAALQTKLVINTPGDRHEQEADRVAERVMRMPEPGALAESGSAPGLQRKSSFDVKHADSGASERIPAPPIVHEVLRSPGQA